MNWSKLKKDIQSVYGDVFDINFLRETYRIDWDSVFLLCNMVNSLAKGADYSWYNTKDELLYEALSAIDAGEHIPGLAFQNGIIYYECIEGQVSFHVVDENLYECFEASTINCKDEKSIWSGKEIQFAASELLKDYLSYWWEDNL